MKEKRKQARRWTGDEDSLLRGAIAKYDGTTIDWQEVATHLEGRSNKDCRKRWVYALRTVVIKGPWTQDEDQRLEAGVELHGCRWNKVSEAVGTRQADQCSRRWHECLNPIINRSRWSLLEDSILECAVRVYGRNWTEIVERFFCDRTPIAARNRYKQRFEKGTGLDNTSASQDQHQQVYFAEMERSSPASSTSEGKDDNNQLLQLPWPEPPDVSAYCRLPDPYITPTNVSTDNNIASPFGTSGIGSGFASLEPFLTCPPTDVPSGGMYPGTTQPIPHTLTESHGSGYTTGLLSSMALPDIEQAFHELCTSSLGGHEPTTNISTPRSDRQSVTSSTSGLATPADTSLPPSSTALSMPDWGQLSSSLSLDQMIRHLASYRLYTAGVQGGGVSITQSQKEGFIASKGTGGVTPWK